MTPSGPVDKMIAQLQGHTSSKLDQISGVSQDLSNEKEKFGIDEELRAEIEKSFGFDKPILERYLDMIFFNDDLEYTLITYFLILFPSPIIVGVIVKVTNWVKEGFNK